MRFHDSLLSGPRLLGASVSEEKLRANRDSVKIAALLIGVRDAIYIEVAREIAGTA